MRKLLPFLFAARLFAAASPVGNGYLLHNLVSDQPGVADYTDKNLVNAWGVDAASGRTYKRILPFASRAVNARRLPSGESTGGPDAGSMVTKAVPAGGRIDDVISGAGLGVCRT